MNLRIFSIRDDKAECFMRPFFAQTTAEGMRIFGDSVNSHGPQGERSGFALHPEDYQLFETGEFDTSTGFVASLQSPKASWEGL